MKILQFKSIITQSTDNTKQYNEHLWTTITLTSWQDAHIKVCVTHTHTHVHTHAHTHTRALCTIKYSATIL
jgi:hypothetical protein